MTGNVVGLFRCEGAVLLFLPFKHFHKANRGDQDREPGYRQAVTLYCVAIKDEAHCRNRSLSVIHLSGYLMSPRAMNQGIPLVRVSGRYPAGRSALLRDRKGK